jgi:hypothetical protein
MHELAISAATYDALFVEELIERLAARLGVPPVWSQRLAIRGDSHPLADDASRVVMVLHQRLWSHDPALRADAEALEMRLRARPHSVCVVTLDDEPVPEWLATVPSCSLTELGVDGVIELALSAITRCGGSTYDVAAPKAAPTAEPSRFDRPTPFLEQHRAFSSLRHELDALAAELKVRGTDEGAPEVAPEVLSLPNRLVVRFGHIGLSFSWVGTGLGTVAEGRLLVIEWTGIQPGVRGSSPLKSAIPVRERVYRPEAAGPDGWRWRADNPNGCAYSTTNLASEWLAGASIAASA